MKSEGYILKPLDQYLLSLNVRDEEGNDRAIDVNAPSQVGTCARARYYARLQKEKDGNSVSPRLRRIYDNGTHFHIRTQEYLLDQGMLIMDEVPVRNDEYNIQGHTDGLFKISSIELGILELKSIKTEDFQKLKDALEQHKQQASVYMFCIESRRKYLQSKYKNKVNFNLSLKKRAKYYESLYQHLEGGRKHTREEKIEYQVNLHTRVDEILFEIKKPIKKCVVVYEDKNNQNMKEYLIEWDDEIIEPILEDYTYLNNCVSKKKTPSRCARTKSDSACKWCDYRGTCWIV